MNKDTVKGNWKQLSGKLKEKWGRLTDDDLLRFEGNHQYLSGRIQERYGLDKEQMQDALKDVRRS